MLFGSKLLQIVFFHSNRLNPVGSRKIIILQYKLNTRCSPFSLEIYAQTTQSLNNYVVERESGTVRRRFHL